MNTANLIEQATGKCVASGAGIGEARNETRMVRVQLLQRNTRKTVPTFRIDVWELPSGKRIAKDVWQAENNNV